MKMYEVGGYVRDEIMGVPSADIDYSVTLLDGEITMYEHLDIFDPYEIMVAQLRNMGVKIFRDNEGFPIGAEHFTARGQAPRDFPNHPGRALDFVLARKEGNYSDGRRPDDVQVGTLMDDLARRDFTMNAIAKDADGSYIDPFNGQADIAAGILRAVGDPADRLTEDALRAVRALRFAVTKGFRIEGHLVFAMQSAAVLDSVETRISDDRISVELSKMFRFNTADSIRMLASYPALTRAMFAGNVSLDSTMKTKGRGK